MFALVDCNNFYASCERLFRPDLRTKPIVVLSNNDGCVIARSNEAKALGIKMGEPYFNIKTLCKEHQVHVFSSNYTLYGDLSQRVMSVIEGAWPEVEIYSIDEAFLDLSTMPCDLQEAFCNRLQQDILKWTGIPTFIGIGKTKTLAKAANYLCKKVVNMPVFNLHSPTWLKQINVGAVWGIGRRWEAHLLNQGVYTAWDLAQLNAPMLKKQYNVILMRTAMELQGISCIRLEDVKPKQSIMSSRSFGEMQTHFSSLANAISSHCARVCEKARQQDLLAQRVYVFVRSNFHRQDLTQYAHSMECRLVNPSNDTRVITRMAKLCLKKLYRSGVKYKKVGVMLGDLVDKSSLQLDLFHQPSEDELNERDKVMSVLDAINKRFGSHSIQLAAEGYSKPWAMRSTMRSPCYTTSWSELRRVKT